jgi:energy-coupling factor transport system permease protein
VSAFTAPALGTGSLARRNPLAKIGAALVVTLALVPTVDALTPALLLACALALVPLTGLGPAALARRAWPVLAAAASVALANALFSGRGGHVLLDAGPLTLTTGGLAAGGAAALRLLAIAVPGLLAVATTDPLDLADALVQQLKVSPRFAYGALAALRLVPLLGEEWAVLGRARRARGVAADGRPLAALRLAGGRVLGLLVGAVRRATRMATAMDARGFGSGPRTSARRQRMAGADWTLLAATVLVAATAVALSVALGTWRPLLS